MKKLAKHFKLNCECLVWEWYYSVIMQACNTLFLLFWYCVQTVHAPVVKLTELNYLKFNCTSPYIIHYPTTLATKLPYPIPLTPTPLITSTPYQKFSVYSDFFLSDIWNKEWWKIYFWIFGVFKLNKCWVTAVKSGKFHR